MWYKKDPPYTSWCKGHPTVCWTNPARNILLSTYQTYFKPIPYLGGSQSSLKLNFLINSCLKIELNSKDFYKQDLFVYLAYIYLTNRYTLDSDKLIFDLNMSDNINNYLINYFKTINFRKKSQFGWNRQLIIHIFY